MNLLLWLTILVAIGALIRQSGRIDTLRSDLRRQDAALNALYQRVRQLARSTHAASVVKPTASEDAPSTATRSEQPLPTVTQPAPTPTPESTESIPARPITTGEEPAPAAPVPATSAPSVTPHVPVASTRTTPRPLEIDWERWLGVRGAAVLGAVALGLAGILFLNYAIQQGLLPPPVRVTLAYLGGAGTLLLSGVLRRRGYDPSADATSGAGIVILYAATWAARSLYGLIEFPLAAVLMIATTSIGGWLAWRHRSQVIAYLGLIGGFATPILLTTGSTRPISLFGYLLILNIGVWTLAQRHGWYRLALVAQIATFFYQAIWIGFDMTPAQATLGLTVLGVFAVAFVLLTVRWPTEGEGEGAGRLQRVQLLVGSLVAPFMLSFHFAIRADLARDPLGFALLLALISALAAWLSVMQRQPWMAVAAASADLALVAVWSVTGMDTQRSWQLLGIGVVVALVFHLRHEWLAAHPPAGAGGHRLRGAEIVPGMLTAGGCLALCSLALAGNPEFHFGAWFVALVVFGAMLLLQQRVADPDFHPLVAVVAVLPAFLGQMARVATDGVLNPGAPSIQMTYGLAVVVGALLLAYSLVDRQGPSRGASTLLATALLPGSMLLLAIGDRGLTPPVFHLVTALMASLIVLVATRLRSGALLAFAAASLIMNHIVWLDSSGASAASMSLIVQVLAVTLFTFWVLLTQKSWTAEDEPRSLGHLELPEPNATKIAWITAALAGPAWFFPLRVAWIESFGSVAIGLLPLGLGAIAGTAAWQVSRRHMGRLPLVWFSAVALSSVAVAIPLQLDREWVTVGWALQALALLLLWRKQRHPGLVWFSLALHAAVVVRLLLNPEVLSYHPAGGVPIVNWLAYTYLVPAACLIGSAQILARDTRADDRHAVHWRRAVAACGGAAILLVFAWLNLTVLDVFAEGSRIDFALERQPARDLTLSVVWALYALSLLGLGLVRRVVALRWVSLAFLMLTIVKVFLYDLGELRDLYRVASLVGLAVSLIVVSLVYQRFVFGESIGLGGRHRPRHVS